MIKDGRYHDPLHIGWDQLTVKDLEGKERFILNKRLMDSQNCWENLEAIKDAHTFKLLLYSMIEEIDDSRLLKELAQDITLVEFELQRLWKFDENDKFHRFWDTPKCQCPKMDNDDAYPTGYYVTNLSCPLHGIQHDNMHEDVPFERSGAV